ncbi:GNAT family N-acetyltransferase [Halobacteriales archaeon SW_7_71_33]|nr:MAG: GNAT family N-acetyltransferase [Halobacteriales archaeon SW_7_71_33]
MTAVALRPAAEDDAGLEYVAALLDAEGLPVSDLHESPATFYVARVDGDRAGAGGIETYGTDALLRSVVVEPDSRGQGVGDALCAALEDRARKRGVEDVYLLTTIPAFFAARGYEWTDREAAPPAVRATGEFESLCPDAAVAMWRSL